MTSANEPQVVRGSYNHVQCWRGIIAAGIARDAALRGYRVALIEKGDFGSGTGSASTRIVHGGLRYLEQFDTATRVDRGGSGRPIAVTIGRTSEVRQPFTMTGSTAPTGWPSRTSSMRNSTGLASSTAARLGVSNRNPARGSPPQSRVRDVLDRHQTRFGAKVVVNGPGHMGGPGGGNADPTPTACDTDHEGVHLVGKPLTQRALVLARGWISVCCCDQARLLGATPPRRPGAAALMAHELGWYPARQAVEVASAEHPPGSDLDFRN